MDEAPNTGDVAAYIPRAFALELAACDELFAFAWERMRPWRGRSLDPGADILMMAGAARGTKTFRASIDECRRGYAEQAAMLNRSLFEDMAVAHWIHANEAEAQALFEKAVAYDNHLVWRIREELDWNEPGDAAPQVSAEELAEMKRLFGSYGTNLWTGHASLRALLRDIQEQWGEHRDQLWRFYDVAHRENNQTLHSTARSLVRTVIGDRPEELTLSMGASTVHLSQGLHGAYWNYGQLYSVVAEHFGLPDRDRFAELFDDGNHAFHRISPDELRSVGRNDPCPCGRGEKFKRCHLEQAEFRVGG
jgi:hypothetical protein